MAAKKQDKPSDFAFLAERFSKLKDSPETRKKKFAAAVAKNEKQREEAYNEAMTEYLMDRLKNLHTGHDPLRESNLEDLANRLRWERQGVGYQVDARKKRAKEVEVRRKARKSRKKKSPLSLSEDVVVIQNPDGSIMLAEKVGRGGKRKRRTKRKYKRKKSRKRRRKMRRKKHTRRR